MKARNLIIALVAVGALVLYQKTDALHLFSKDKVERHVNVHVNEHFEHVESRVNSSDVEVMIERSFRVQPGELLRVDIQHSDLIIETGSGNEANVRVELEANDMERGKRFFNSLNYMVEETSDGIEIRAERDRDRNWSWNSNSRIQITAYVSLPREFDYDLRLSHGDATLASSEGSANIFMSHGDLRLDEIDGEEISIRLSHGDLESGNLIAGRVDLTTSHGDMDVRNIRAQDIEARSSHGDIAIRSASGMIRVDNSHGDIEVGLSDAVGGRFSNSHGDITLSADNATAADVDFSADRVRLSSGVSFDGTITKNRAEGSINGGGQQLIARTSHGSISLRDM